MSKVKECFGRKEKARHQLRRYETRHKKLTRAKNYNLGVYGGYGAGYWVDDEVEHRRYEKYEVPERHYESHEIDWEWFNETGEVAFISVPKVIPAYMARKLIETYITKTFKVKRISKNAKYYKQTAARKFRRNNKFDEENYDVLKGNKYKRNYDIAWEIW